MSAFAKFKQGQGAPAASAPQPALVAPPASRFARPGAALAQHQAPARAPVNKYSGLQSGGDRDPYPGEGVYRFRVVSTTESNIPGKDPYFKAVLEVLESSNPNHPVGSRVTFSQCVSQKAISAGGPRVKSLCMAFTGYESDPDYDAFDPDGTFMQACAGYTGMLYPDGTPIPENPLAGQVADAQVTLGKAVTRWDPASRTEIPTGDFYRNYSWSIVTPEELAAAGLG